MAFRTRTCLHSDAWRSRLSGPAILCVSMAFGTVLFWAAQSPRLFLFTALGAALVAVLVLYPELALALYVVVGDIKGDAHVAALFPFDLTLALGAVLLAGIALNLLRKKRVLPFPRTYWLFVPLVVLMTASLAYTPDFYAGLDKLGRFLTVTAVVIVAPFFVLGGIHAMKRFFISFALATFAICAWSFSGLGGSARLVTPSDNTIGLGHIACDLFLLVWFGVVARISFPRRLLSYALLVVPTVALLGAGSRGSLIACTLAVFISLLCCRRLWLDAACFAALAIAALPFLDIPASSFSYLGTLFESRSFSSLLAFRGDLLAYGWRLLQQHPLLGVGINGFRYRSPNAALYKWPHNIFLEIACELGIPAALMAVGIFFGAFREAFRQLRDHRSSNFLFSQLASAFLLVGAVNSINTGNINSDRATWLFVTLVFVAGSLRTEPENQLGGTVSDASPLPG